MVEIRDRIKELRRVKASELIPNRKNWRRHPAYQADALRGVLDEIGYADALIARETPDGLELIDGHLRAETTPDSIVPVLVLDVTEAEADKLLATLDPLSAMARPDTDALLSLLETVQSDSEPINNMLEALANGSYEALTPMPFEEPERKPSTPEQLPADYTPFSKRGQIWQLGDHRLMCGDCTSETDVTKLMDGGEIALIVADPPYGISHPTDYGSRGRGSKKVGARDYLPVYGDGQPFDPAPLLAMGYSTILWGGNYYASKLPDVSGWLVWDKLKPDGLDQADAELAWTNCVKGVRTFHHLWNGMMRASEHGTGFHPTQKPVALMEWCITKAGSEGMIFDPYAGASPVLLAAEKLGRRCYAMEIEPRYVDVSIRRWEEFTGRKAELVIEGR